MRRRRRGRERAPRRFRDGFVPTQSFKIFSVHLEDHELQLYKSSHARHAGTEREALPDHDDGHRLCVRQGAISASRGAAAPSRHRCDSCPSDEAVGGLIFDFERISGEISASCGAAAPSRHRCDSCPSHEVVGGLFFDFEAIRTESSDRDAPRR